MTDADRAWWQLGRFKLAWQNFEEGGLAGAVGTDDAIAVAFREFDIYIFEKSFFAHTKCYIICTDH